MSLNSFIAPYWNSLKFFLTSPSDGQHPKFTFGEAARNMAALWMMQIPVLMLIGLAFQVLETVGIELGNHAVEEMFKEFSLPMIIFLAAVLAPFLEELIFRTFITYRVNPTSWWYALVWSGKSGSFSKLRKSYSLWKKLFPIAYYSSSLLFGAVHLFNFEISTITLLLSPILVAPQIIIGLNLGYIRVRYGLIYAMLFHAAHNFILVMLAWTGMSAMGEV